MAANEGKRFEYRVYYINEKLGWGYQLFDNDNWETYRRNYGFKTMSDAEESAQDEINKME